MWLWQDIRKKDAQIEFELNKYNDDKWKQYRPSILGSYKIPKLGEGKQKHGSGRLGTNRTRNDMTIIMPAKKQKLNFEVDNEAPNLSWQGTNILPVSLSS